MSTIALLTISIDSKALSRVEMVEGFIPLSTRDLFSRETLEEVRHHSSCTWTGEEQCDPECERLLSRDKITRDRKRRNCGTRCRRRCRRSRIDRSVLFSRREWKRTGRGRGKRGIDRRYSNLRDSQLAGCQSRLPPIATGNSWNRDSPRARRRRMSRHFPRGVPTRLFTSSILRSS